MAVVARIIKKKKKNNNNNTNTKKKVTATTTTKKFVSSSSSSSSSWLTRILQILVVVVVYTQTLAAVVVAITVNSHSRSRRNINRSIRKRWRSNSCVSSYIIMEKERIHHQETLQLEDKRKGKEVAIHHHPSLLLPHKLDTFCNQFLNIFSSAPPGGTTTTTTTPMNSNSASASAAENNSEPAVATTAGAGAVAPPEQQQKDTTSSMVTSPDQDPSSSPPSPKKFNFPPKSIWESDWIRNVHLSDDAICTAPTMDEIQQWTFDPLLYKDECLQEIFPQIMRYYNFDTKYDISPDVLAAFSHEVMVQHNDVVYHNWFHIISVLHITFMLLEEGGAAAYLHERDIFAVLLAAFIHDVDHTGKNNDYENKRNTDLSQRYQQKSVLENNSLDVTWNDIVSQPRCNVLETFTVDDDADNANDNDANNNQDAIASLKEYIKEIVLLTDVATYHGGFAKKLHQRKEEAETQANEEAEAEPRAGNDGDDEDGDGGGGIAYFDKSNKDHRLMLCQAIIKAADISNPILSNDDAVKDWCLRISTEFKDQVDQERAQDLQFVPFMDVNDEYEIAKGQIGFYSFMVIPYFTIFGEVLPKTKFLQHHAKRNLNYYKDYIAWVDTKKQQQEQQTEEEKKNTTEKEAPAA